MKLILFKIDLIFVYETFKNKSLLEVKVLEKTVLEALVLEPLKMKDGSRCMSVLKLGLLGPEILGVKPKGQLSTFNYFILFYDVSYVQIFTFSFCLFLFQFKSQFSKMFHL